MSKNSEKKIPLKWAILFIFLSIVGVTTTATSVFYLWKYRAESEKRDPAFNLVTLIQRYEGPNKVETNYLADLLGLSADQPVNFHSFSVKEKESAIQKNPLFKEIYLKKIRPGKLLIQYQVRSPVAFLGEFTNTAIDSEGVLIPYKPFFKSKALPIIYMGLEEMHWGDSVKSPKLEIAFSIAELLKTRGAVPVKIDVSKMYALSYGQRQIVVKLDNLHYLRLSPKNYQVEIENYLLLKNTIPAQSVVIDLRIQQLAFVKAL